MAVTSSVNRRRPHGRLGRAVVCGGLSYKRSLFLPLTWLKERAAFKMPSLTHSRTFVEPETSPKQLGVDSLCSQQPCVQVLRLLRADSVSCSTLPALWSEQARD